MRVKQIVLGLVLSIAGLLSVLQTAQAANEFYLGGGVGRSRVSDWCDNTQLTSLAGPATDCNEGSTAFNLYAGYRFLPYLAVEAGYTDFGKATLRFGTASGEVRGWGVPVYAVGILPLATDRLWLMAKAGAAYWTYNGTGQVSGISASGNDNGINFTYGAGVQYNFTDQFGIRAEYDVFNKLGDSNSILGSHDVRVWTVGVNVRF